MTTLSASRRRIAETQLSSARHGLASINVLGELIAEGRTSKVYALDGNRVAKVLNDDVPRHWAHAEAAYTSAVRSLGVRAPEVFDIDTIDGRLAILFERISGPSMWDEMLMRPNDLDELIGQFVEVQRTVHRAGVPELVPSSRDRMCRKIASVEVLTAADRIEACDVVRSLPSGGALLHGDLHPANVLMADDGPVPIDWFDATVGHPISDVVRTALLLRSSEGTEHHLAGAGAEQLLTLHDRYVETMFDVLADEIDLLGDWEAAAAASRLAEGTDPDPDSLIERWSNRASGPPTRMRGVVERMAASVGVDE